jgi:hypothetical protein
MGPCRKAVVQIRIDADFDIAPIQSHHVLQIVTDILKSISELDKIGCKSVIESKVILDYIPVRDEDLPIMGDKK